jgi:hypothetical protein
LIDHHFRSGETVQGRKEDEGCIDMIHRNPNTKSQANNRNHHLHISHLPEALSPIFQPAHYSTD